MVGGGIFIPFSLFAIAPYIADSVQSQGGSRMQGVRNGF